MNLASNFLYLLERGEFAEVWNRFLLDQSLECQLDFCLVQMLIILVPKGFTDVAMSTQQKKLTEHETNQVAARLAKADYDMIRKLVEAGLYRSSADFLREAVRNKLRTIEVTSLRDVDVKTAEKMIEEYLETHSGSSFVSEMADDLGIGYHVAFKAVRNLLEHRLVRKAKA